MNRWRRINQTWCGWPSKPIGLIEMIGGSYLSATPTISYKRLLEGLLNEGIAIHSWSYIPGFDHQTQANQAWKDFRICKKTLMKRVGDLPFSIKLGHSLGCKLHLISPDKGRNNDGLIAISFNNFNAKSSIPILGNISKKLEIKPEFKPSPIETRNIIVNEYIQPRNLLINFEKDNLDQSQELLKSLQKRNDDNSSLLTLSGGHLTPASAGVRSKFLGEWADDYSKKEGLLELIKAIRDWSIF